MSSRVPNRCRAPPLVRVQRWGDTSLDLCITAARTDRDANGALRPAPALLDDIPHR